MKSETKEIKSKKVKNNRWQPINLMVLYRHKENTNTNNRRTQWIN